MVFVMDDSGSIGNYSFEKMKRLAIDITQSFEIGLDRTRVAWISFSYSARVVFHLDQYSDKALLHEAIDNVTYRHGGNTAIGEALETLRTQGFIGGRNLFDIPEVAILVTDGRTNSGINSSIAAERLRTDRNVNVFAVGVGNVNIAELEIVASAGIGSTEDHIYHIYGFIDDQLNTVQELIKARTCFGEF